MCDSSLDQLTLNTVLYNIFDWVLYNTQYNTHIFDWVLYNTQSKMWTYSRTPKGHLYTDFGSLRQKNRVSLMDVLNFWFIPERSRNSKAPLPVQNFLALQSKSFRQNFCCTTLRLSRKFEADRWTVPTLSCSRLVIIITCFFEKSVFSPSFVLICLFQNIIASQLVYQRTPFPNLSWRLTF